MCKQEPATAHNKPASVGEGGFPGVLHSMVLR